MIAFVDDGTTVPCAKKEKSNETKPKILFYFFLEKERALCRLQCVYIKRITFFILLLIRMLRVLYYELFGEVEFKHKKETT